MLPDPTEVGGWYLMANVAGIILLGELVGWAFLRSISKPETDYDNQPLRGEHHD